MIFNRAQYFNNEIQNSLLISKYNYNNIFQIPNIDNITVVFLFNNSKKKSKYYITTLFSMLFLLTGQYPKYIRSNKKVIIGCKVILRKTLLFYFLDKINTLIVPYIKNYKQIVSNFINNKTYLICFKQLGIFYEFDTAYKNYPKYFLRFSQNVNCFVYFNFTNPILQKEKHNILSFNQISFIKEN
jgi:ribosomal protein L5